jgi:DNA-binding transcriptional regulator YbjK
MDPLRPFTSLVDSLWRTRTDKIAAEKTQEVGEPQTDPATPPAIKQVQESLETRLRQRIRQRGSLNADLARDVFVETVLAWEIGEHVIRTPGFEEITHQVSSQIAADPQLSDRLNELLRELVA